MRTTTAALALLTLLPGSRAADPVDYLRDVKPLLAKKCYNCHGGQRQRSDLRLDTAAFALKGGVLGPAIVPGKSADSLMLRALRGTHDMTPMPPREIDRLGEKDIALIARWIDEGAKAPSDEVAQTKSLHWVFRTVSRPAVPVSTNWKWAHNPIDLFVLQRLDNEKITPSPEADRATLIRRVSLDLIGLPPTSAEVEAFVNDAHPQAYERLVDRLLSSPHYGERWGRVWLDLARYADSNGFTIDGPRTIWPYRDWVIDALNRDLPFDQFTVEQLAGDLLPKPTREQRVATGFHRNTLFNQEGGIDQEQFRVDYVIDRVSTTGTVWLGLTVGCAQCHDHKFDPISQKEFYQFFAFFNSSDEPSLDLPTPAQEKKRKEVQAKIAELEKLKKAFDKTSPAGQAQWEKNLTAEDKIRLPDEIQRILLLDPTSRDRKDKEKLFDFYRQSDLLKHAVGGIGLQTPYLELAHINVMQFRQSVDARIVALKKDIPPIPTTMVIQERTTPRPTTIMIAGDFTRKGAAVSPGIPAVLPQLLASKSPNRLDLARWLVDPANPMTARVAVNRLWQQYFGVGLVETENDFGAQGTPPSHPELLDWLADEFVAGKWSLKHMHRLIVTSATYRQSSKVRPDLATVDPRNRLLARQTRIRLDAEVVRDNALAASGLLSTKIGGPSVFPPQPEGVYAFTQLKKDWKPSTGPDRYRRGLYTYIWRSAPHPGLTSFDAPDGNVTCTRRTRSNTPLQALTLLNDEAYFEVAQALALRGLNEYQGDDAGRLRHLFRISLARDPKPRELQPLERFLARQLAALEKSPEEAKKLAPAILPKDCPPYRAAAWALTARVLMNLDEFITRE